MSKINKWLWGSVLIALGVILGINALGIADINIFFPGWWTLFIIVPSIIGLITEDDKLGSLFGLIIGVMLLSGCLDLIGFDIVWRLLIPVTLIMIGIKVIFKSATSDKAHKASHRREHEQRAKIREGEVIDDDPEYWATFSGQKISYSGKEFDGCRLEAVFGGLELDLRGAKIAKDAVIKASGVFGGVKIFVDDNVDVEVSSSSLFGGVTNNHKTSATNKKTLYIDATCIFGGVEIK